MLRSGSRIFRYLFATKTPTQQLFKESVDSLVQSIQEQLKPTFLRVKDISLKTIDDDQMLQIEVEAEVFRGIPKVDQHRMIIACFG